MIDVAASEGWLAATLRIMTLVQMCIQGRWSSDSSLLSLPHVEERHVDQLNEALSQSRVLVGKGLKEILTLAELQLAAEVDEGFVTKALGRSLPRQDLRKVELTYSLSLSLNTGLELRCIAITVCANVTAQTRDGLSLRYFSEQVREGIGILYTSTIS